MGLLTDLSEHLHRAAHCGNGAPCQEQLLRLLCTLLVKDFHHLTSVDCEQDESFHLNKFLLLIWRPEWQHDGYFCTWSELCFLWYILPHILLTQ